MRSVWVSSFALALAAVQAQERCDAPYPQVYCNTTEILQYETQDCRSFHIFVARGSDEPYPGRLGNLTKQICAEIGDNNCGFENIEYPAKSTGWGKEEWCKSAGKGATNGQAQMKSFSEKCPKSKLILLGFSQGASVAQDILGGGGGQVFECEQATNPPMDASTAPGSQIVAAVTFGAVVRSRGQNFTVGEGNQFDGRRARTAEQLQALNKYSTVLRDYCHYGDPMCAVGSKPEDTYVHLNYFEEHNSKVAKWVAGISKGNGNVSDGIAPSRPTNAPSDSSTPAISNPAITAVSTPATDDPKPQSSKSSTTDTTSGASSSTKLATNGNRILILAILSVAFLYN